MIWHGMACRGTADLLVLLENFFALIIAEIPLGRRNTIERKSTMNLCTYEMQLFFPRYRLFLKDDCDF